MLPCHRQNGKRPNMHEHVLVLRNHFSKQIGVLKPKLRRGLPLRMHSEASPVHLLESTGFPRSPLKTCTATTQRVPWHLMRMALGKKGSLRTFQGKNLSLSNVFNARRPSSVLQTVSCQRCHGTRDLVRLITTKMISLLQDLFNETARFHGNASR